VGTSDTNFFHPVSVNYSISASDILEMWRLASDYWKSCTRILMKLEKEIMFISLLWEMPE